MYMAAGSGIPEIKTILSGFVIPNFLDFKVLLVLSHGRTDDRPCFLILLLQLAQPPLVGDVV